MKEFIQNEYSLFLTGKLNFDLIFVDSFSYLNSLRLLDIDLLKTAFAHATEYRRKVLQRHVNQDGVRATSYLPVTQADQRRVEFKIRVWCAKQLMVYWWYQEQQEKGVKKLFVEIPEAVSL